MGHNIEVAVPVKGSGPNDREADTAYLKHRLAFWAWDGRLVVRVGVPGFLLVDLGEAGRGDVSRLRNFLGRDVFELREEVVAYDVDVDG
jgi:hypothetical protein